VNSGYFHGLEMQLLVDEVVAKGIYRSLSWMVSSFLLRRSWGGWILL
jgi:hypothetical protein